MPISDVELAGLSEEERAALADAGPEAPAAEESPTAEAASDDATPSAEQADAADTTAASDNAPPAPEEDEPAPFVPTYQAQPVADYDAKLADLKSQFEEGDLTMDAYLQARDTLNLQRAKAEIAAEQAQQAAQQHWQWEIDRFMEDNGQYKDDPILYAALDAAIKSLANKSEHADRSGRWFLQEAHRQVQEKFTRPAAPAPASTGKAPTSPRATGVNAPPVLSQIPSAGIEDTAADEFSNIDQLFAAGKTMEGERALARLSADQQRRYLEAA